MAELAFEFLNVALETVKGTAIAAPTHTLNMVGTLNPTEEWYRPDEARGLLAAVYRSKRVRRGAELEAEGPLDVNTLPVLLALAVKGGVTPTTPTSGILTRLWTHTPTMVSDDLKSLTAWWGDNNIQAFQSAYLMASEIGISSDASGTDGAMQTFSGWGRPISKVTDPVLPPMLNADLIVGGNLQVWIDTTLAIGTTEITGRVISAEHTIPTGSVAKYLAAGPTANLGFTRHGRGKRSATTTVVMELLDSAQYDIFDAGTSVKLRVRHNGGLIETVAGPLTYYNYAQVDVYGPLQFDSWGDLEGTNRTVSFTVTSHYDATLGADFSVAVQNQRTVL